MTSFVMFGLHGRLPPASCQPPGELLSRCHKNPNFGPASWSSFVPRIPLLRTQLSFVSICLRWWLCDGVSNLRHLFSSSIPLNSHMKTNMLVHNQVYIYNFALYLKDQSQISNLALWVIKIAAAKSWLPALRYNLYFTA